MPTLQSPFGSYSLKRLPNDPTKTLKAWDAADEYLLDHIYKNISGINLPLILNDTFGALGISLHKLQPVLVSDSIISNLAFKSNCDKAGLAVNAQILNSIDPLPDAQFVIIKQPKTIAYLDYQLRVINHYLPAGTPVVIGGMVKYLSKGFFDVMGANLDDMHTSLARKKARLIFGKVKGSYSEPTLLHQLELPEYNLQLCNTPNVFASNKIDIGSRFFLDNFPTLTHGVHKVIDLGCGNGVLGIYALQRNSQLEITFLDESWHAIYAATHSTKKNLGDAFKSAKLKFIVNNCLQGIAANSVDVVLCNPPFHQQQATSIQIARQMFSESASVIKESGQLYVIGNRHLNYRLELKKYFREVELVANNKKFIMLVASAPLPT